MIECARQRELAGITVQRPPVEIQLGRALLWAAPQHLDHDVG